MDRLLAVCDKAEEFPRSEALLGEYVFEHHLEDLYKRLADRATRLFEEDETKTVLHFLELAGQTHSECYPCWKSIDLW